VVVSPAVIGSGAVWPSFATGEPATEHGIYSQWVWDAEAMGLAPASLEGVRPFWARLAAEGRRIAVLDVPFTRPERPRDGVEIVEWGAHDWVLGRTSVHPPGLRGTVAKVGRHPFAARPLGWWIPQDAGALARFATGALEGVRRRGELALRLIEDAELVVIGFSEVHRAGHVLWQTIAEPGLRPGAFAADPEAMREVVRETDRQIGRLFEAAGPDAAVLVFSLHGMCVTRGVPTILDGLLEAHGLAAIEDGPAAGGGAASRALQAAKRATPLRLKWLGHRLLPTSVARRIQGAVVPLAAYDWSRTAAFSLPTDQHGWIRLNLRGREREGIVDPAAYDETCESIEQWLLGLEAGGERLVERVLRTSDGATARHSRLPDLVVHWVEGRGDRPVETDGRVVVGALRGTEMTGQHAPEGLLIARAGGGSELALPSEVAAEELGGLIERMLTAS
jgi:predicted AlkP superfamily phosphohydrolase/phosphomutase